MGAGGKVSSERHGKAAVTALLRTGLPPLVDTPEPRWVAGSFSG